MLSSLIREYVIMRTWEDFKKQLKKDNSMQFIEEMETLALIVSAIIERRRELEYSQRELADICGIPHSSVARIESCSVRPNVETILKIMKPLGLTLSVSQL